MREDIWRLLSWLALAAFIGWLIEQPLLTMLCTAIGYILWQQRRLVLLLRWVENRKEHDPPECPGVLDALCREIDFMRERHRRRKKKLGGFLKQFQEATAAIPDGAVVLGPADEIQWVNAAAQELLPIQWPRDISQRIINLVRHPELVHLLESDAPGDKVVEIAAPGRLEVYISIAVVPMGQQRRLLLARNVTRLHKLNQIRSDFVANVSHELRTPVTVIKGYLEALNTKPEQQPPEWRPIFAELEIQASRMGNIIDELLLLARLEQDDAIGDPEPVNVPDVIARVVTEIRALVGEIQHDIAVDVDDRLWLLGARGDVYSAFSNLAVNAVRYTAAGGRIGLRWYRDADGAHFEVTDTGIGIPKEHIPRLTERFYRVDRSRSRESGGTGLGLAIVKHVLKRHGGKLHISSEYGRGSCFRCDFPVSLILDAHAAKSRLQAARRR